MRYLSVCSGVESVSLAWEPLGFEAVAFAEIDRFPATALDVIWPNVPNLGDMAAIDGAAWRGKVDILVGGTPCQSFSVAGLRKGLADDRGNLSLTFVDLADAIGPAFVVWENVPGILSHPENPFGCFLGGLVGESAALEPPGRSWPNAGLVDGPGRRLAWRVLDAQYFGLAQRRRRLFVVACPRDGADPAEVLFEPEGLQRHSAPRRETGEDVAGTTGAGAGSGGAAGTLTASDGGADELDAVNGRLVMAYGGNNQAGPVDVATARNAYGSPHGRLDFETETFVVSSLDASYGHTQGASGQDLNHGHSHLLPVAPPLTGNPYGDHESREGLLVAHSLRGDGFDASEDGTGRGTPIIPILEVGKGMSRDDGPNGVGIGDDGDPMFTLQAGAQHAIAFSSKDHGADAGDTAPTLRAMTHDGSHANGGGQVAVAFQPRFARNGRGAPKEIADALRGDMGKTGKGDAMQCVVTGWAVRRLTPRECERLQGMPDDHTLIPWRGKNDCPDGPRYKAIGNAMAVPVMAWIGERIRRAAA